MNNHEKFQLCLQQAKRIVNVYRSEAPEGLDPQNSWVAVGVGVAGIAASSITAATAKSNTDKAQTSANASLDAASQDILNQTAPTVSSVDFPSMPSYVPVDFNAMAGEAYAQDVNAYAASDADFAGRHGKTVQAENKFEQDMLNDQTGDYKFLPQYQRELTQAGLGNVLNTYGDKGQGQVLVKGSAGEAEMARQLGLNVLSFQDRQRSHAQQSLSLAEQIFPRRQLGLSGQDAASIYVGNNVAANAWNSADYSNQIAQMQYNKNIDVSNADRQMQLLNSQSAAEGQLAAAQAGYDATLATSQNQLYGTLASSAIAGMGNAYSAYSKSKSTTPTTSGITSGASVGSTAGSSGGGAYGGY